MPLSVNQPISAELQRPMRVLTWRVLAVIQPTCRKRFCCSGDGGVLEGGASGDSGGGGLLAEAEKVRGKTEEED